MNMNNMDLKSILWKYFKLKVKEFKISFRINEAKKLQDERKLLHQIFSGGETIFVLWSLESSLQNNSVNKCT